MLLALPQLPDAWDAIRGVSTLPQLPVAASGATAGPVLLFVSGDVDSVATARTLTALLKSDLVRYEVHPVAGYAHLAEIYTQLTTGESAVSPRAVLCINCGGTVDLTELLDLEETVMPVFVLDCHRPFHLRNLSASNIILLDDDENTDDSEFPMDLGVEDMYGNVSDHDFSDASSDDSDDDSSDDDDNDSEDDIENDNEFSDSDRSVETDIESIVAQEDSDADSEAIDDLVNNNNNTGNSDNTEFKSSILGETDTTTNNNETDNSTTPSTGSKRTRTPESGETSTRKRSSKRRRRSRRDEQTSKPKTPRRRRRKNTTDNNNKKKRNQRRRRTINVTPEERARIQEYYRKSSLGMSSACLSHNLAHTLRRDNLDTLWLAIVGVTSQYIASNITEDLYNDAIVYFRGQLAQLIPAAVTDENGVETSTLENVGYSTSTAKDLRVRKMAPSLELRLDLIRHWSLYESLLNSSYTVTRLAAWKQTGKRRMLELLATLGIPLGQAKQSWCFMNADCKDALDGRLPAIVKRFDLGSGIQYESFVRALPGHRGAVCAADVALCVSALLETSKTNNGDGGNNEFLGLQERFWNAYDALAANASLTQGLDLAIESQAVVAGIVNDVIERKKVALFLIEALARQGAKHKPFVVLAPDHDKNTWLAVAATPAGRRNDFGARFQQAAERNKSHVRYAGFDSAVVEIADGQEVEFVRYIHDVLR